MQCAESLNVQALFDGEADPASAARTETHVQSCAECQGLLKDLGQFRSGLRDFASIRTPPEVRARLMTALDQENARPRHGPDQIAGDRPSAESIRRRRSFSAGLLSGIGGTALAAGLLLFTLMPRLSNPLLDDLVSAHLRSLMPAHLIDVVSTDKHTVKPWFAGHADVSPVVADFERQGYRLVGGRADYFDRQRAAVVVYQHGAHIINVFSWIADQRGLPTNATRNGFHLAFWQVGDLAYCAVSDADWEETLGLAKLLQALENSDNAGTSNNAGTNGHAGTSNHAGTSDQAGTADHGGTSGIAEIRDNRQ